MHHILPIISILASAAFLFAGTGLIGLLIPVRAQIESFSAFQIGWISTFFAIGFTIGCVQIPLLVRRVGHVRTFAALSALLATVMLINAMIVNPVAWMILRAVTGFSLAGCYMVCESWLNERGDNSTRGMIFSVYMIVTQVAIMGGQYLLIFAQPEKDTLFMLCAILYALAVIPTAVSKAQSPAPLTEVDMNLKALFRNSPIAAIGSFFSGIISSGWGTFAPVFGHEAGFDSKTLATLMASAMIGAIIFQYPIGRLSDRLDRRYVMIGAGLAGATLGFTLMLLAQNNPNNTIFFLTILIYGGTLFSIYSLNVAHANDHADPADFVKTAGGLLVIYGAGTMAGPLFTAQMMDFFGANALFLSTATIHLLYSGYAIYRVSKRESPDDNEQIDFQTSPMARVHTPETYNMDPRSEPEYYETDESTEGTTGNS
jgi:MFS family permease